MKADNVSPIKITRYINIRVYFSYSMARSQVGALSSWLVVESNDDLVFSHVLRVVGAVERAVIIILNLHRDGSVGTVTLDRQTTETAGIPGVHCEVRRRCVSI